jgi:hypothetical protein
VSRLLDEAEGSLELVNQAGRFPGLTWAPGTYCAMRNIRGTLKLKGTLSRDGLFLKEQKIKSVLFEFFVLYVR